MAQPKPNHESFPPPGKDADVLPFKARAGGERLNLAELSDADYVAFYVQKWNDPSFHGRPLVDVINVDLAVADQSDELQKRLQHIADQSPLFDHYDELLKADKVLLLLDSTIRSTLPEHKTMTEERRAMRTLLSMRAAEIIQHPDDELAPQLAKLPLGDERLWEALTERLAKQE